MTHDPMKWTVTATVASWSAEQVSELSAELGREPTAAELAERFDPELSRSEGNMLVNAGLAHMMNRVIGAAAQALDNTHLRLGVGDSATAEAATQTDVQAATNKYWQVMDATYPTAAGGVITARATFAGAEANFNWNEWALDVATAGTAAAGTTVNTMINRKVQAFGTKASGEVRQLTITITLT